MVKKTIEEALKDYSKMLNGISLKIRRRNVRMYFSVFLSNPGIK